MPFGWNHVWVAGDDWQATYVINMFFAAMTERLLGVTGTFPTAFDSVVDGFDLQDYRIWSNLQQIPSGTWIVPNDYTGQADFEYIDDTYIRVHTRGGQGWTRKYPLEVINLVVLTYTDGSGITVGDYARNLADGKVYHRVGGGGGVWVLTPHRPPDIQTTVGFHQAGDYIGPWLLNEIRDMLNLLVARVIGLNFTNLENASATVDRNAAVGSGATLAIAQAASDSTYGPSAFDPTGSFPQALSQNSGGPPYSCNSMRIRQKFIAPTDPTLLTPDVELYVYAAFITLTEFDSNGDFLGIDVYYKFDTQIAPGTGGLDSVTSILFGPTTGNPTWSTIAGHQRGYVVSKGAAVIRYDSAGGFTYHV